MIPSAALLAMAIIMAMDMAMDMDTDTVDMAMAAMELMGRIRRKKVVFQIIPLHKENP